MGDGGGMAEAGGIVDVDVVLVFVGKPLISSDGAAAKGRAESAACATGAAADVVDALVD